MRSPSRGGKLFVNGKPQKEPYTNKKLPDRSSFTKTTVPEEARIRNG